LRRASGSTGEYLGKAGNVKKAKPPSDKESSRFDISEYIAQVAPVLEHKSEWGKGGYFRILLPPKKENLEIWLAAEEDQLRTIKRITAPKLFKAYNIHEILIEARNEYILALKHEISSDKNERIKAAKFLQKHNELMVEYNRGQELLMGFLLTYPRLKTGENMCSKENVEKWERFAGWVMARISSVKTDPISQVVQKMSMLKEMVIIGDYPLCLSEARSFFLEGLSGAIEDFSEIKDGSSHKDSAKSEKVSRMLNNAASSIANLKKEKGWA
jgi:hypothetical protein